MLEAMGITLNWDTLVAAFVVILVGALSISKVFTVIIQMFHGFTR